MERWLLRATLAVGLGWSLAAAGASAQDPISLPGGVLPGVPYDGGPTIHEYRCPQVPILRPPSEEPQRPKPICDYLHHHGFLCWTPLRYAGCSSMYSRWTFMFGSCREFFGEPCMTGPLPMPGLDGSNGGGGCGCRP